MTQESYIWSLEMSGVESYLVISHVIGCLVGDSSKFEHV